MSYSLNIDQYQNEPCIQASRKEQLIEVSVFLFLIIPSMALSFFAIEEGTLNFVTTAIFTILRDLALVCMILFFLWHNSESILQIGFTFKNVWKEIVIGMVLFVPIFLCAGLLERVLLEVGFSTSPTIPPPSLHVKGIAESLLASVLVAVVAIAEEAIFRGYLILRFNSIIKNMAAAVFLSAVIFSFGHGYEGTAGVITVFAMGLAYALIYVWRKSLVAPIVTHFIQDFIGILILPYLGSN
jgi:uncharacterized protein